jgi:hypothetical protein
MQRRCVRALWCDTPFVCNFKMLHKRTTKPRQMVAVNVLPIPLAKRPLEDISAHKPPPVVVYAFHLSIKSRGVVFELGRYARDKFSPRCLGRRGGVRRDSL